MSSTFARVSVARVRIAQDCDIRTCEHNRAAMKEDLRRFSETFRLKQVTNTASDSQPDREMQTTAQYLHTDTSYNSAEQTADEIEMMDLEVPTNPKYELIKSLDIEAEKRKYMEKREWSRASGRVCRLQGLV